MKSALRLKQSLPTKKKRCFIAESKINTDVEYFK